MKTLSSRHYSIAFLVFLLGAICTLSIGHFFFSNENPPSHGDFLYRIDGANDKEKLDSIIDARKQVRNTAYTLVPNGSGTFLLTVNLPAFFTQTPDEQNTYMERVYGMGEKGSKYDLLVNISGKEGIDVYRAEALVFQYLSPRHLDIEFYDLPSNYHELLDARIWRMQPDTHFTMRIHGPAFPYRFSLTAFVLHAKKMAEQGLWTMDRTNGKLESFTLEVKDSSGIDFDLSQE